MDIKEVDEQEKIQKERARNLSLLLGDGLLAMQRQKVIIELGMNEKFWFWLGGVIGGVGRSLGINLLEDFGGEGDLGWGLN